MAIQVSWDSSRSLTRTAPCRQLHLWPVGSGKPVTIGNSPLPRTWAWTIFPA
jgi:hypothetical protein